MDRIGRRKLLIASTLILSASALLVLRASSFTEILVYLGINGLAQQMWQMARLTVIADSSAQNRRGRMITGMAGVNRAGTLLGPLAGGAIALVDLRLPFLFFGIFALLATVPSYLFIRETAPAVLARRRGEAPGKETDISWARLITRPVVVLFTAQFMANVGRGGVQGQGGIYVAYAAFAYGLDSLALGSLSSAMGIVGIPVTLMAGQVMDRFGRKTHHRSGECASGGGALHDGWRRLGRTGTAVLHTRLHPHQPGGIVHGGLDADPGLGRGARGGTRQVLRCEPSHRRGGVGD